MHFLLLKVYYFTDDYVFIHLFHFFCNVQESHCRPLTIPPVMPYRQKKQTYQLDVIRHSQYLEYLK